SVYNRDSSHGISPKDDGSNSLGYNHSHIHAMFLLHNSNNSPDYNRGCSCNTSKNGSNSSRNMSSDNSNSNRGMSPNNNDSNSILPDSNLLIIERATDKQKNLEKNKEENLYQILSSEIVDTISGLTTYIKGNKVVLTEEFLDDEQIVELATQSVKFDSSSSDEELVLISYKEGLEALTTFINYFGQQTDAEFKVEDLKTLKKYNNI
ncbi:26665_t:CDS:2, partial [Gigaspora margarita]